jgi:hypothetical protein
MTISADAWLGALTATMMAIGGGMIRLIITATRTETLLRDHLADQRAHVALPRGGSDESDAP